MTLERWLRSRLGDTTRMIPLSHGEVDTLPVEVTPAARLLGELIRDELHTYRIERILQYALDLARADAEEKLKDDVKTLVNWAALRSWAPLFADGFSHACDLLLRHQIPPKTSDA